MKNKSKRLLNLEQNLSVLESIGLPYIFGGVSLSEASPIEELEAILKGGECKLDSLLMFKEAYSDFAESRHRLLKEIQQARIVIERKIRECK